MINRYHSSPDIIGYNDMQWLEQLHMGAGDGQAGRNTEYPLCLQCLNGVKHTEWKWNLVHLKFSSSVAVSAFRFKMYSDGDWYRLFPTRRRQMKMYSWNVIT